MLYCALPLVLLSYMSYSDLAMPKPVIEVGNSMAQVRSALDLIRP